MYEAFDVDNVLMASDRTAYSLYILVAKDLHMTYYEAEAMLGYVKAGNDLVLSADYIDPNLLGKFECNTERVEEITSELKGFMTDTKVKLFSFSGDTSSFGYYYYPSLNFFSGYDFDKTTVLGWNEQSKPNFVVMQIGKGRVYMHAAPRTFGNYFLLKNENHAYLEKMLGYVRPDPKYVYWDEYYKFQRLSSRKRQNSSGNGSGSNDNKDDEFSSFKVINQHESLKWAFWLSLLLLLLFALFNMKRRQRIVPQIKANENTTVAFTETIGRLYLQKKNNKNISEKMITYFYEHLRKQYFLSTTQLNNDFTTTLAKKSGVGIGQIETLFRTISSVQSSANVEDFQLLSLNEQIQNFYKNKN
ncbi:MAG: DUF4350 domain-containing protein [Chitinophagaceae bacterium]